MSSVYAVIENGVVANLIVWDGKASWSAPVSAVTIQVPTGSVAGIGSTYSGGAFSAPPAPSLIQT